MVWKGRTKFLTGENRHYQNLSGSILSGDLTRQENVRQEDTLACNTWIFLSGIFLSVCINPHKLR